MDHMEFKYFGEYELFKPRQISERRFKQLANSFLISKCGIREYCDPTIVNEIIKSFYNLCSDLLEKEFIKLASWDFMEFVLYQFDQASSIEQLYKNGKLNETEKSNWVRIGPTFRRAAKFISEKITTFSPENSPSIPESQYLETFEMIWICAEEMVRSYMASDTTYLLFPENTLLRILPESDETYWTFTSGSFLHNQFQEFIRIDTINRKRFISGKFFPEDHDKHDEILGEELKKHVGVTYKTAIGVIANVIENSRPDPDGLPVPFIKYDSIISQLSENLKCSEEIIEKVLSGFIIPKKTESNEVRELWNPKQEYRAYIRGFFEFPHPTGKHIIFSKNLASESLQLLIVNAVSQKLPKEWRNEAIDIVLSKLAKEAGQWFENTVIENLNSIGIHGVNPKRNIGSKGNSLRIPNDVGEIDFLGYSSADKAMIICEFKMVAPSFEPKYIRDDVSEFIADKNSYKNKFKKKIQWVIQNNQKVLESLKSEKKLPSNMQIKSINSVGLNCFRSSCC